MASIIQVSASPLTQEGRLAESSDASEPMFAYGDREVPERKGVLWGWPREARAESVVTGTWRLMALRQAQGGEQSRTTGPDRWTVSTLREDRAAAIEAETY